jgi:hypothetical protein
LPWLSDMLFGHASLPLTPPWERDRLVLVPAVAAARLAAEGGCHEVAPGEVLRRFDELPSRNRSSVREFAVAARPAVGDLRLQQPATPQHLFHELTQDAELAGETSRAGSERRPARRDPWSA